MTIRPQRSLAEIACLAAAVGALFLAGVPAEPAWTAHTCGTGFTPNAYNSQCLAPVSTPVINGVPCVASNLGLCSSFVQNQQPPRVPRAAIGGS